MRINSTDAAAVSYPSHKNTGTPETGVRPAENMSQAADVKGKGLPVSEKLFNEAIDRTNKALTGTYRRFEFSIHEGTKDIMVKVIDTETNEVVREIPPEKILDLVAKLWELAGLFVDERR